MDAANPLQSLRQYYDQRDIPGLVRLATELKSSDSYPTLLRRLVASGRLTTANNRAEDLACALIGELEAQLARSGELTIDASYFEIAAQLKRKYGEAVESVYLASKMPDDFLFKIRSAPEHGDAEKLTDDLVEEYKQSLIRIEKGRRVIVELMQPYSNLPIKNARAFAEQFNALYQALRSNYKYLTVKPYLQSVATLAGTSLDEHDQEEQAADTARAKRHIPLFKDYLESGEEPTIARQVEFQFAVARLFQFIGKQQLLDDEPLQAFRAAVSELLLYQAPEQLPARARKIFEDLIVQIKSDQSAILRTLAITFIEECRCAEEQMKIRHRMIRSELAYTNEFLQQVAPNVDRLDNNVKTKVKIALEKLVCLKDVFTLTGRQQEEARSKPLDELERAALAISTVLTPAQLTSWIKIYSIIFSNRDFLDQEENSVDLEHMRQFISDLTTYHLIQNIAQLKIVIDRSLASSESERASQFKRFNNVFKLKLQGLMSSSKQKEKSLGEMIRELEFLQDDAVQFVIAETFEGFQTIIDAFNSAANDFFVRDRETLLKESRALYNEICNQCLKGIVSRPELPSRTSKPGEEPKRRGWLGRLFS